ncbi:MAG: photosystem II stability/assembly factor-like uncharacterized protein [Rhodothermales bacterium]|jgi:photosystem II stability/assembly factor-like uncharacterized protein
MKSANLYTLLLTLVLAPSVLAQQSTEWVKVGGPFGGSVRWVEASPNGDLWIEVSGLLARSFDTGLTWAVERETGPGFDTMVFAGLDTIITSDNVSLDGGRTWRRTGLPDSVIAGDLVFHATSNSVLVAGREALWRSEDLGVTFDADRDQRFRTLTALDDGTLVGTYRDDSVYLARSIDGGKTWKPELLAAGPGEPSFWRGYRPTGRPWQDSTGLYVTGTGGPWVTPYFRSADSGETWTIHRNGCRIDEFYGPDHEGRLMARGGGKLVQVSSGGACQQPYGERGISDAAMLPGGHLVTLAGGSLSVKTDQGNEWHSLPLVGVSATKMQAITPDPRVGRWWVGTSNSGAFKSDDGGISWNMVGFADSVISDIAVGSDPDDIWLATKWAGLFSSRDAGQTWDFRPNSALCGERDYDILLDIAYLEASGTLVGSWDHCNLFSSDDGGQSWIGLGAPTRSRVDPPIWASHLGDDGSVLASMLYPLDNDWEILRRRPGDGIWERVGDKLPQPALLVFEDSRGKVWAGLTSPGSSPYAEPRLARTEGGLYSSEAPDTTWTLRALTGRIPQDMIETPDGTLWLADSGGVSRSVDGGETWAGASQGLSEPCVHTLAWDPFWREVLAGTCHDGMYTLALPTTIDITEVPVSAVLRVSAFPNPFSHELGLELEGLSGETRIELFDVLGRRVLIRWLRPDARRQSIETSSLAPGLYIYRVTSGAGVSRGAVVRRGR